MSIPANDLSVSLDEFKIFHMFVRAATICLNRWSLISLSKQNNYPEYLKLKARVDYLEHSRK